MLKIISVPLAEQAETLAKEFGGSLCPDLNAGVAQLHRLDVLVSCVPASAELSLTVEDLTRLKPIVLDAAYRPRQACAP